MAGGPIYKGGIPFYKPGVRFKNNVVVFSGTGAPVNGTSGTYAGKAGKGSLYIDYTNANVYMNTNTLASPTWSLVIAGTGASVFSSTDNITAFAGGGQASATVLTTDVNRVTTVATRGDSVALPAAAAGLVMWVVNAGAQPMAVFPVNGGTDKINGQAANASVIVIPNEVAIFTAGGAGNWQAEIGMGNSGSIPTDIYRDTITAFAGGGQGSATLLDSELNRVTTVATLGDSIKLPVSAAGMGIIVVNHGANDMQVFGSGTDTIDDVPTATGVSQMKNSIVLYFCVTAGAWYSEGLSTGFEPTLGLQTLKTVPTVTAFAGGGQGSATALTALINRVSVVATAGDSVKLPASAVGLAIVVINNGANDMQVFGAGTDTVDGVATATGVSQASGTLVVYDCAVVGNWISSTVAQTSYGLNRITDGETLVADSNATVTAAQLLKGFLRSIPTAARTWTLDTAANIDSAIPGVKTGHNFVVYINNNSAGANSISFTAGAGMTFFPAAGVTIAQNKTATLTFFRTGAGAWSVYHQVGA